MNKEELIKAVDRIFNNCEEIDNHNPVEDRTGYKMLKDITLLTNGINDLQQRIDKAIQYMNSEEFFMKMNSNSIQPPADKYVCQDYFEAKNKLVNILGGDVD